MTTAAPPVEAPVDADALLELALEANKAEHTDRLNVNDLIHKGDATAPVPMVVSSIDNGDYIRMWDTRTFEERLTLSYMVRTQILKRREDGSRVWTFTEPTQKPYERVKMKCLLHAEYDTRPEYDEMGLPTCRKANIPNSYAVRRHMLIKHKGAWDVIEGIRVESERETDRAFQKQILIQASGVVAAPVAPQPGVDSTDVASCPDCGSTFGASKTWSADRRLQSHKARAHKPEAPKEVEAAEAEPIS